MGWADDPGYRYRYSTDDDEAFADAQVQLLGQTYSGLVLLWHVL